LDSNNLEIKNIRKVYPGTIALQDTSMCFKVGKVHAWIGKKGPGKAALGKVLQNRTWFSVGKHIEGKAIQIRSMADLAMSAIGSRKPTPFRFSFMCATAQWR